MRKASINKGRLPLFHAFYSLRTFVLSTDSRQLRTVSIEILAGLLFLLYSPAYGTNVSEVLSQSNRLSLANHPTWLQLLHYERHEKYSAVLTDNFFLSQNGRSDPSAELDATIRAYFAPWGDDSDQHARCRFPARYFWLSKRLPLPDYKLRESKCHKLEKWALFETVKSISVLLVSGYLGNPASTFGHALLKLNTDSLDDESGLFDLTVNYGALVPENENTLRYVTYGLFGGYEAGFSDKYFYTEDLVYSHTELRDIWDYRLNLTDEERALVILHIWEIVGKKFRYFFLNKNCSYRLAELLALGIEEELLSNARLWYLPVELFHRLVDIDESRRNSRGTPLIQSVRFIPSSQRRLYSQLKLLSPTESRAFNAVLREGSDSLKRRLFEFAPDRQMVILDALLAYHQYRLVAEEPNPDKTRRRIKDQILLTRLLLPAGSKMSLDIPKLPSPAEGSRPMEFGIGGGIDTNDRQFWRLNWSPHKKEIVGKNSLEGDEFVVSDLAIGILEDSYQVFLDKFDLIRILHLNTLSVHVEDESRWSWQLRLGSDRIEHEQGYRYDGIASFGAGNAWKWNERMTGYIVLDVAAHSIFPHFQIRPHLGWLLDGEALRTWWYIGAESVNYNGRFAEVWGGKVQYSFTNRYAIRFEISSEVATRASIGLTWYW